MAIAAAGRTRGDSTTTPIVVRSPKPRTVVAGGESVGGRPCACGYGLNARPRFAPHAAGPGPADAEADEHAFHAALQAAIAAESADENRDCGADGVADVRQAHGKTFAADAHALPQLIEHLQGRL